MKNSQVFMLGLLILFSVTLLGCNDSSLETSVQKTNITNEIETKKILEEEILIENKLESLEKLDSENLINDLNIQSEQILKDEISIEESLNELESLDF